MSRDAPTALGLVGTKARLCVATLIAFVLAASCGARSTLDTPAGGGAGGAGVAPLVCASWLSCGPPPPPACSECVNARLATCGKITDCDAGTNDCSGDLTNSHTCRVWAVEAVECMLECPDDSLQCADAYFQSGHGPTFPVGLAFADFHCAVCGDCAAVCAGTPNFSLCAKL